MTTTPIRICLVADHAALRQSLALLLSEEGMVVREWGAGPAAAEPVRIAGADVAIVALSEGAGPGLDFVDKMTARESFPPCIVLSAIDDPSFIRRAFVAGARGYLTHREIPGSLARAVREVTAGGLYGLAGCEKGKSR